MRKQVSADAKEIIKQTCTWLMYVHLVLLGGFNDCMHCQQRNEVRETGSLFRLGAHAMAFMALSPVVAQANRIARRPSRLLVLSDDTGETLMQHLYLNRYKTASAPSFSQVCVSTCCRHCRPSMYLCPQRPPPPPNPPLLLIPPLRESDNAPATPNCKLAHWLPPLKCQTEAKSQTPGLTQLTHIL